RACRPRLHHQDYERRDPVRPTNDHDLEGGEMMVTTGLIVRLTAKAGKAEELASFLRDALPLVEDEPETIAWFAVAIGAESFAIIDAFPGEQGRQAHLNGLVAEALSARAGELLAVQPQIEHVDVLAAKLTDKA